MSKSASVLLHFGITSSRNYETHVETKDELVAWIMAACKRHLAHFWDGVLEPVASLQCQNQQCTQRTTNKGLWKRKWLFSICAMSETSARGLPNPQPLDPCQYRHERVISEHMFRVQIAPPWPHLQSVEVCINIQLHPVQLTVHFCQDSFSTLRMDVDASSETLTSVFQTTY
jgi:hypothetical protein